MDFYFKVNGQKFVSDKHWSCPVCGCQCAANILPVSGGRGLKFVEVAAVPEEASYSETLGDAACYMCADEADQAG